MTNQESNSPDQRRKSSDFAQVIDELISLTGMDMQSLEADLIAQMISNCLRMANENFDRGQLKLMTRAFKEMRYAYHVFNEYRISRCISIFGSARISESHPDYQLAKSFSSVMAAKGWVCMTGAADGIMRAGLEGAGKDASFGLSIRLPFEQSMNALLAGDPKLINFNYFFTRKLMFLSHSDALAAFPGGVGTLDELFEAITLMQTGKSNIVPLVLLEAERGHYWQSWEHYLQNNLLAGGYINSEDQFLYYRAPGVQEAVDHILHFYRRFHSSRYVKDTLVIRLVSPLATQELALLNDEFENLVRAGKIEVTEPFPEEDDHLELPRICFQHSRQSFGLLRAMIDRINSF
jgi:uncharacterized protein (TIGR00730 family)